MRELKGGFINNVVLEDNGTVRKTFKNDCLVGVSSAERIENEIRALSYFGGDIAPRLIHHDGLNMYQEFIEGESYEARARKGEKVFRMAGQILARIHQYWFGAEVLKNDWYLAKFLEAVNRAKPILELEKLSPAITLSRPVLEKWGTRYVHGDFWLGNIIGKDYGEPKVIDWEFSGIESPFRDFAINELWIFREFPGSAEEFWYGYGEQPDQDTINSFLILKCVEFLTTTTLGEYLLEEEDGFYHNKVRILRSFNE